MFKAMTLKELRETAGIMIVAVLFYGLLLLKLLTSENNNMIPFAYNDPVSLALLLMTLMAMALGLWQTFGESARGTYPFLLHRPASIRWLIGMKLVTGLGIYLIVTAIPLGFYAIWAATPGNHASPFEWSMTAPVWVAWLAATMVYLGAFLSGILPGRWYGSRFLPLAASFFPFWMILAMNTALCIPWWLCVIILAVDALLVTLIFFVAKARDYS